MSDEPEYGPNPLLGALLPFAQLQAAKLLRMSLTEFVRVNWPTAGNFNCRCTLLDSVMADSLLVRSKPLREMMIELTVSHGVVNIHADFPALSALPPGVFPMKDDPQFLSAIVANPTDDGPRLGYADWLDEFAEQLPVVYRGAYQARAELIRLQVAIARGPNCPVCRKTGTFVGPKRQFDALMLAAGPIEPDGGDPDRIVSVACPLSQCEYNAGARRVRELLKSKYPVMPADGLPGLREYERKGRAHQPMAIAGEELWRPGEFLTAREVRFSRGFVGLASYTCASFMRWAGEIAKAAPLEMVVLCDRRLNESNERKPFGRTGYFWAPFDESHNGKAVEFTLPGCVIPEQLWWLCDSLRDKDEPEQVQDCYKWLSWAAVYYARKRAGLEMWLPRPQNAPTFTGSFSGVPTHYDEPGSGAVHRLTPEAFANTPSIEQRYIDREKGIRNWAGFAAYYESDVFKGTDQLAPLSDGLRNPILYARQDDYEYRD